jgi:hypothetical protein
MKLRIRFGKAIRKVTPRADGPGGKIRVKNKQTGKTTFVSPKTLEDHPDRYEGPGSKRKDKQKRRELARKEVKKRELEKQKKQDEDQKTLEEMPPEQRKEVEKKKKQEQAKQKALEKKKQEHQTAKEDALKKRQVRKTKEEEGREKSRVKRERAESWKGVANDHPELTPEQQVERKKLYMEEGIDSGGRSSKAIRWWLQHHGTETGKGQSIDKPKEPKKLDRKTIQEHFKYGPKPTKKGECSGQLKAVKVGNVTICVDPNVYDVPEKK